MPYIVTDTCILCGVCSAGCPTDAITEDETQAHIDVDLCIECGTCVANCLVDAITYMTDLDD